MSLASLKEQAAKRQEACQEVKHLIVDRLDLPVSPDWITDDQPLVARGLELDSVDTLELMIGIEMAFGEAITDDEIGVFGSVSRIVDRIEAGEPLEPSS